MTLSLDKPKLDNLANEIWKSAERLRGKFKAYEYQNVILPIIVIRRLECVLLKWREDKKAEVRARQPKRSEKEVEQLVKKLEQNPQQSPFFNKTDWTLRRVYEEDHTLLEENFRAYINGFSQNVDDIIEHFNYRATIGQVVKNNRLAPILNQYKELDLGPDQLSNLERGYIYEELLRRFSEQSGEEAGEHFTPREVIRLMLELLAIPIPEKHLAFYDPACGTGGMLSVAKEHLLDRAKTPEEKERVEKLVTVHGQEMSPTNYAICQADLLIKDDRQAKVFLGNSLIPHDPRIREPGDQLPETQFRFDFMLSNPPFGVTWGGKDGYETEAKKLRKTRYQAGMPRTNDGALLFLQTMLAKMQPSEKGGSRIAIIFNGSPLSNGDCGSGESEIRRRILENDWLDAIVMLPDQLFYNTGIFTYIWLLRNEKLESHLGRVMLIDARKQFEKEPKSFGNKRNRITDAHRGWIEKHYRKGWKTGYHSEDVKLFKTTDFAYHKVRVVFWQIDENDQPAIITEPYEKTFTPANIKKEQEFFNSDLHLKVHLSFTTRPLAKGSDVKEQPILQFEVIFALKPNDNFQVLFESAVKKALSPSSGKTPPPSIPPDGGTGSGGGGVGESPIPTDPKSIIEFLKTLKVEEVTWTHRHYLKDDEYIPYDEDIEAFLKREIAKPIIRWQDSPQLGYEILPNKYFYRYQPPPPAKELLEEFRRLEKEAEKLLERLANA
jgi:type I restriction enzyme M protein